jgi:hypothetical protein
MRHARAVLPDLACLAPRSVLSVRFVTLSSRGDDSGWVEGHLARWVKLDLTKCSA